MGVVEKTEARDMAIPAEIPELSLKSAAAQEGLAWPDIFKFMLLFLCLSIGSVVTAWGQEEETQEQQSPDSINETLERRDELAYDPTRRSMFPESFRKLRQLLYTWERRLGLEITFSYDALAQQYSDEDQEMGGAAGDAALSGRWLLFGSKYHRPNYLAFRFRSRHAYTEDTPADIASENGMLWGTVDGFNDAGFQIPSLYFSQELHNGDLILRYGQFSIDNFVDSHSLRSAKRFFLNEAFSENPTVNFPSYGAGFLGEWKYGDRFDLTFGGSNIQGLDQDRQVDFNLTSSALFMAIQGSLRFAGLGGRNARIQGMGWYSDAIPEDDIARGQGFSITVEQQGEQEGEQVVLRYAASGGESTNTRELFFMGYGKAIRTYDHWGVGLSIGRFSVASDWQGVLETYYRWQVTKELMITPDLQLITNRSLDETKGFRFVAGLRMGITF